MAQLSVAHPSLSHVWSCCQCCRGPVTGQFCNVSRERPLIPAHAPLFQCRLVFLGFCSISRTTNPPDCLWNYMCKMSADVIVANFLKMEFIRLSSDSANERQATNR